MENAFFLLLIVAKYDFPLIRQIAHIITARADDSFSFEFYDLNFVYLPTFRPRVLWLREETKREIKLFYYDTSLTLFVWFFGF